MSAGPGRVAVTQADLDAAADLIEQYWSGADDSMMRLAKDTRSGHRQGAFPRAFSRHRTASTAEAVEMVREARADIAPLIDALSAGNYGSAVQIVNACRGLAKLTDFLARAEGA